VNKVQTRQRTLLIKQENKEKSDQLRLQKYREEKKAQLEAIKAEQKR